MQLASVAPKTRSLFSVCTCCKTSGADLVPSIYQLSCSLIRYDWELALLAMAAVVFTPPGSEGQSSAVDPQAHAQHYRSSGRDTGNIPGSCGAIQALMMVEVIGVQEGGARQCSTAVEAFAGQISRLAAK